MNLFDKIFARVRSDLTINTLYRIVLILLCVLLLQSTAGVWAGFFGTLWNAVKVFVIGFIIAYIFRGPIVWAENHNISKKVSVPVLYLILLALITWLIASLLPMIITRASSFITTMINSISWLYQKYLGLVEGQNSEFVTNLINQAIEALGNVQQLIPNLTAGLPDMVNKIIGGSVTGLISIIVSIFMCFSWDKFRYWIFFRARKMGRKFFECLFDINEELGDYLRSMLVLMLIRVVEYSLLYFLVGHSDWLILGVASAVSIIIPYLAPTLINVVGILTALTLSPVRIIILVAAIVILSQVDEYVIRPIVHMRNVNISPLWTLFSIFVGNAFLGVVGIIIAIPVFLILRCIWRTYSEPEPDPNHPEAAPEAQGGKTA